MENYLRMSFYLHVAHTEINSHVVSAWHVYIYESIILTTLLVITAMTCCSCVNPMLVARKFALLTWSVMNNIDYCKGISVTYLMVN